ncbi:MAG: hypothetical protein Kilf2KO_02090 [Rhodospirillales bacterium]
MRSRIVAYCLLLPLLLVAPIRAESEEAGWSALADRPAVLILRHAQTTPGTGDPANFRLGDCETQRNLSAGGKAQAQALGEALRARGVTVTRVLASPWCRTRETAELLAVGPVEESALLASTWNDRLNNPDRSDELRAKIAAWRGPGALVLVTHGINIAQLLGRSTRSGGGFVLLAEDQGVKLVAALP